MAGTGINVDAYSDALLVLATAGVVVPLGRRFGVSSVLGFLVAGAILGPLGIGSFKTDFPILRWFTITDAVNVAGIADLGVVFLLFLIGLELSFERLSTMRRLVFGLGGLQVTLTATALTGGFLYLGVKPATALILGMCLALSSTAIVLDVLSGHRRLATTTGRATFAVLLAQDLAVVPLFLVIAVLAQADGGSVVMGLLHALFNACVAMLIIVAAGRYLLRPLLRLVADTGSRELFIAAILLVVVGSGVVAAVAGLSMALGAFVAGLMLAETEYRKTIEAIIEPFKSLLLGVFFFTIGMKIDLSEVIAAPLIVLTAVVALIGIKVMILYPLMRLFRLSHAVAIEASPMLGPGGEFAFVGIGLAAANGIIEPAAATFALAVTSIGMALIPLLHTLGQRGAATAAEPMHVEEPPGGETGHTIIVGFGRFGQLVAEMLQEHRQGYLAVDTDIAAISGHRKSGKPIYFGNATDFEFLERCGLEGAKALVVTIHDRSAIDKIVAAVRTKYPELTVVARARDAEHASHLYSIGVTDAVPETIEASLQLTEAVLVGLGVPAGPVIAAIHEKRDEFRHALQRAASNAGHSSIRSIRAKTLRR